MVRPISAEILSSIPVTQRPSRPVKATSRIVAETGEGEDKRRVEVEERFYRNLDLGYATTIHKSQGATVDRVKVLASLSLDRHLTYVAMTRHREDLQLFYGERSFQIAGGLDTLLSRRNAKETTLDYAAGRFYRQALSFANSRGLHLMRVARTLARDRLEWTLRQKRRLADLGRKLRAVGARIGLVDTTLSAVQSKKEAEPMVKGVTTFAKSIADVAAERVHAEKEVARQWEEVSDRFRLVFADPEAAFRVMDFDAVLADPAVASERLGQLAREPASRIRCGPGSRAGAGGWGGGAELDRVDEFQKYRLLVLDRLSRAGHFDEPGPLRPDQHRHEQSLVLRRRHGRTRGIRGTQGGGWGRVLAIAPIGPRIFSHE